MENAAHDDNRNKTMLAAADDASGPVQLEANPTTKRLKVAGNFGSITVARNVGILVTDPDGDVLFTGDNKAYFRVPAQMNGYLLSAVAASVSTVSSSGAVDVQVRNVTAAADMLTTSLTIDASETDSSTAATPAVIDTANDDVSTGDQIAIDIDGAGTGSKGLYISLTFIAP